MHTFHKSLLHLAPLKRGSGQRTGRLQGRGRSGVPPSYATFRRRHTRQLGRSHSIGAAPFVETHHCPSTTPNRTFLSTIISSVDPQGYPLARISLRVALHEVRRGLRQPLLHHLVQRWKAILQMLHDETTRTRDVRRTPARVLVTPTRQVWMIHVRVQEEAMLMKVTHTTHVMFQHGTGFFSDSLGFFLTP